MPPTLQPDHTFRDIDGTSFSLFCRVEQIGESTEPELLVSRLHEQGVGVGRWLDSVYVCFEDNQIISLAPQLLRLLPNPPCGS